MNIAAAHNLFLKRITARFFIQRDRFELDAELNIPSQGITALFGLSGSGKTSLLRCIAGLEMAKPGFIKIDDELWQDRWFFVPVHKRNVGYVFQDSNLFEHMTVADNLRYGYKRLKKQEDTTMNFDAVVDFLNIEGLLTQYPAELSGGQKQRVAIGRALLSRPRLLLMDEPLASLDVQTKNEILPYLDRISRKFHIPIIYVSHSPDEIIRIADHLVLMDQGRVVASGDTNELFTRLDLPLAHFDEGGAVVHGRIHAHDTQYHLTYVSIAGGKVAISANQRAIGDNVKVRILARDVSLTHLPSENSSISNVFPVRIVAITGTHDPAKVLVKLDMGGESLLAHITLKSCAMLELIPDQIVYAQVKSVALMQ